jgi:hypothetical protein
MLEQLTIEQRARIREQWLDSIIETYPADTVRFLRSAKDRFANPVGHTLVENIGIIAESLWHEADAKSMREPLEKILKIRSVQDFSASDAVGFVFALKAALRDSLTTEELDAFAPAALDAFDRRVDALALQAFDVYMHCRERIYEIRANEIRNRTHLLLERTKFFSSQSSE